jgi:hypothetical protein
LKDAQLQDYLPVSKILTTYFFPILKLQKLVTACTTKRIPGGLEKTKEVRIVLAPQHKNVSPKNQAAVSQ